MRNAAMPTTELLTTAGPMRLDVHRPLSGAPRRVVIFVSSGRQGLFDQLGPDAEIFERLAGQLLSSRMAAVRFDCDGGRRPQTISDDRRLLARADRIIHVIQRLRSEFDCPFTLFGLSLGALAIVESMARAETAESADTLVLCSACIDRPTVIMAGVHKVHLVYGALDGVAYVDGAGKRLPVKPPSEYASRCQDNLIVMPKTEVSIDVLPGRGHLLLRPGAHAPDDDTVSHLVRLAAPEGHLQRQPEILA